MTSKNFLLVSLDERKAKELAQIVSNDVCRKILDCLAAKVKGATETEISKELEVPLSTVHYNLRQLVQSGIVKTEEFHYSTKGREVLHYSLANKYIIIAPKATESLAIKLKRILPVFAIVAGTGIAIQLFTGFSGRLGNSLSSARQLQETGVAQKVAETAVPPAAQVLQKAAEAAPAQPSIALWFAIGALFAIVVYFIYDATMERSKRG